MIRTFVTRLRCANTAEVSERIEVLLGVETFGDPRNIDGSPDVSHGFDATFAIYFGNALVISSRRPVASCIFVRVVGN